MSRRDAELKARLLATFRTEAEEHLGALSANLLALGEAPQGAHAPELVETTFREMHTLKGAARSVGLRDVEQLCGACESLLSALKRGDVAPGRGVLATLEEGVDAVARLLAGDPAPSDLVARLGRATADPAAVREPEPQPAPREPAPARAASPGTIRLAAADVDALLRRAEDLLAIKLASDDWVLRAETLVDSLRRARAAGDAPELRAAEAGARSMLGRLQRDRRSIAATVDGLLDETRRVRMTPAASVLSVFPRMVRDVAEAQSKEAAWVATGGELEVDRRVLETIKDPLIHLVRNALDHGLESPQERVAAGKPRRGRIVASVRSLEGGRVEIVVADDGRGIDPVRVRDAARRARVDSAEDAEPLDLIFRSGLSTSFVITDVSGHGLGLAIVKEQVERLGGQVAVESRPGAGTSVRLIVPATIATFRGLLVHSAGERFLISLDSVERVVRIADEEPVTVEGHDSIRHDGAVLPCARLDALLEIESPEPETARTCAIVSAGGERAAIRVDEVIGEREVLVKDFAPPLVRVRNVAGAGLLGAGQLVLILRPIDLVRGVKNLPSRPRRELPAAAPARAPSVLVVDDAVTTRAMERGLLEMAGYDVSVAVDGVDAWTTLRAGQFDLVVSDVDMPRMDGFELTMKIRADERLADLPVVLVSALEERADKERGIEVGANAYVVKSSFERSNLLEIIRRLGVGTLVVIRVLVAEDSAVTRAYLVHLIERDPGIALAGEARDGEEAVALAASERPDVILMDVHMPRLNGYEATRKIMQSTPTPIVMATASSSELETHGGFRALEAGALVLVDKPPGLGDPRSEAGARDLVRTLKLMAEVKVVRRWGDRPRPTPRAAAAAPAGGLRVLAIGASTGGPPVVAQLLRTLPEGLEAPVLVVQHIGAGFASGFAEWLATEVPRRVKLAEATEIAAPDTVYIAPGGAHLGLTRGGRIVLDRGVARHGFRPSISHLFDSVASSCGAAAVGILLTGMGRDGADGLRRLRDAGALTIAQDQASSVVFGMPGEAVRLGAAKHVLPPDAIAGLLRSLAITRSPA